MVSDEAEADEKVQVKEKEKEEEKEEEEEKERKAKTEGTVTQIQAVLPFAFFSYSRIQDKLDKQLEMLFSSVRQLKCLGTNIGAELSEQHKLKIVCCFVTV